MEPATITIIIMLFAVVMFILEKIPLSLTAMLVCTSLAVTGVITPAAAFAGFVNPAVILFAAMFVIGGAFFETGMARKVGLLVTRFAKTERQMIVAIMLATGLVGSVLSNTATAAIFIPIVIGIADQSGFSRSRLLLAMAFAANLSGNLTLIASPGNLIAHGALGAAGVPQFGFFDFGLIGLPILIAGVIYFALLVPKLLPERTISQPSTFETQKNVENVPRWKQVVTICVLIATIILMTFESVVKIPIHVIATAGAIVIVLSRVTTEEKALKSIDLRVIFLFSGVLPLATALERTGAGLMITNSVIGLLGENATPFALLVAVFLIAVVLTNFISNTATAALLIPLAITIANSMGADPRAAAMATVIGASMAFATPICTPPNTMVYTLGGYRFADYTRVGLPLIIIGSIISLILLPIFFPFFP
ncbi:MAG: SLC13 family permease [Treponema sp.]|nr:SLC13 family permease [Treponema sp.]